MRVCHVFSGLLAFIFLGGWLARGADNLLITEFMAVNSGTVLDEDGDAPDWIEIHNAGTNSVNLNGWFLTDKASDLTQWRFPGTNLLPNAYLLIFASGKDRRVPGAPLHTSFQLRGGGEYLALIRPDGTNVASAFAPGLSTASGRSFLRCAGAAGRNDPHCHGRDGPCAGAHEWLAGSGLDDDGFQRHGMDERANGCGL